MDATNNYDLKESIKERMERFAEYNPRLRQEILSYLKKRDEYLEKYPGYFVALLEDKCVGVNIDKNSLKESLKAGGLDKCRAVILQVGNEFPVIELPAMKYNQSY